ncbi:conserved hypothetical protein [Candidatus Terasakiella magnetica]|nr:conserved hypothetical protein [Candidatus Terasakiella magnetica]
MTRPTLIAIIGLAVTAIAALIGIRHERDEVSPPSSAIISQVSAVLPTSTREPSFDVVRIDSGGDSVIAGRALPGAVVTILDNGAELGQVTADSRGEWVFVPSVPLPPGTRQLRLKAQNPDGTGTESGEPVILMVPERGKGPALAVKPGAKGSKILQAPGSEDGGALSLDVVDHDDAGHLFIGGRAPAGAKINLYMDNTLIGATTTDADGYWRIAAAKASDMPHLLRADQIGPKGKVMERVEIAWTPGDDAALKANRATVVVVSGNSLWRIAHRLYGSGMAYTVIYQNNKSRIRNPDLIYPGQVFSVPK